MKFLKIFGITIGAIIVVAVLVLGYFGFIPGVSNLFGSNKPVSLGTTYTSADYDNAIAKSGVQFLNKSDSISLANSRKTYGSATAVNVDFTPSEVLALLNEKAHEPDFPIKDWQLRINQDGTGEISAVIMTDKIDDYLASHGGSSQAVLDTIKKAGIIENELPFYFKGSVRVTNGQLSFDATSLKIGRLPISVDIINNNKSEIANYYNTHKNDVPGFSCNNFNIANGKIHFDGTLPSSVSPK